MAVEVVSILCEQKKKEIGTGNIISVVRCTTIFLKRVIILFIWSNATFNIYPAGILRLNVIIPYFDLWLIERQMAQELWTGGAVINILAWQQIIYPVRYNFKSDSFSSAMYVCCCQARSDIPRFLQRDNANIDNTNKYSRLQK